MLRKPRPHRDPLGARILSLRVEGDLAVAPGPTRADVLARLRRIAAEAVILQDEAVVLLGDIRAREPLRELAPRGGRIVSRFVALAGALPVTREPDLKAVVERLRCILDHHAMLVASSLDLLAVDWRSERMVEQLERLDGLGPPAAWLEAIRAQIEDAYAAVA
jgi:hypothetical protein